MFRGTAILLTQFPLVLFIGAQHDLLFGFNRMDSGFTLLLLLFLLVPLLNLVWVVVEIVRSLRSVGNESGRKRGAPVLLALFFLAQSLCIDLYIASHARM